MGTTPNYSWPYPESSDFVADGATAIENLADAADATVKSIQNDVAAIGTWTSFSPAWVNLTVGNGVQFFYYCVIGDIMLITGAWQLGSTSSIGTGPYFTIPGGYSITGDAVGASKHWDVTAGVFSGYCDTFAPSNLVQPGAFSTSGSFATAATLTAIVPFMWAPGDVMYLSIYMKVS